MTLTIDAAEFERLHHYIQERVGIQLNENQTINLERTIESLLKSYRGVDHFMLALNRASLDAAIWQEILQIITIGETYFFRNQDQFNALRTSVLPEIIRKHRKAGDKQIRIWSAGCASGEEIYSIAILLRELIPDFSTWLIHLLGTDINAAGLERAEQGIYRNWSFRNETPEHLAHRWFSRQGDQFKIDASIREMVTFGLLNLVSHDYPSAMPETQHMDLILFRNVSIYFDQPTTLAIIKRLQSALTVDGWLVVGHAEPLASIYQGFTPQNFPNAVLYQNAPAQPKVERVFPLPISGPTTAQLSPVAIATTPAWHTPQRETSSEFSTKPLPPLPPKTPHTPQVPSPTEILSQAKLAADQENWDEANRLLAFAERQNKFQPEVYYLRALVQMQTGDLEAAMVSLRRTIYCDSKFALAFYTLGEIYEKRKAFKDAARTWELARSAVADLNLQDPIRFSDDITVEMLLGLVTHRISLLPSLEE
jgi:chemotaxis protein methyltransferase CheR